MIAVLIVGIVAFVGGVIVGINIHRWSGKTKENTDIIVYNI
jgi:hypothetical protein